MKKSELNQSFEEEDNLIKNQSQKSIITNKLPSITQLPKIKSSSSSATTTTTTSNYYHKTNNKLRKSFSEDINPSIFVNDNDNNTDTDIILKQNPTLSIKSSTTDNIEKIKSRSRFSVAFQSLRRKTKSIPIPNNNNNNNNTNNSNNNKKSSSFTQISSLSSSSAVNLKEEDINLLTDKRKHKSNQKSSSETLLESKKFSNIISKSNSAAIESVDIKSSKKLSQPSDLTPTLKKNKSKLSKKFSLVNIKRKNKFNSRKTKSQLESPTFTSSSTQTPKNFESHIPEDCNLTTTNSSQQNLFESIIGDTAGGQNKRSIVSASRKFEIDKKDEKSLKIEQSENKFFIITTSSHLGGNEGYLTALPEISGAIIQNNSEIKLNCKKQKEISTTTTITTDTRDSDEKYYEHSKLNVTESTRDTPPLERAPPKPILNPNKSPDQYIDDRKISFSPITIDTKIVTAKSLSETEINTSSPPVSDTIISGKGAIRKTTSFHPKLRRQQSRDEYFDSDRFIRREENLDRGRRIPRPPVNEQSSLPNLKQSITQSQRQQQQQQQQKHQQQQQQQINNFTNTQDNNYNRNTTDKEIISIQSGNNIKNQNLSGLISIKNDKSINQSLDRSIDDSEEHYPLTVRETKIQFSVDKAEIRSTRLSLQSQSQSQLQSQLQSQSSSSSTTSQFILNKIQSTDSNKDCCSIDSNKSSRSQSPISEGSITRRKIKYIDQKTFYTEEERDILTGKRETYSHLSGISEYSLDSEFSIDTQMPAFGDLTMDHEEAPIMTTLSSVKREHLYKILVIGELGTGKTSFIKRYVHQFFSQNYRATIGVDFALKVLNWDKNTLIRLQLWDIAGQERFGNMTRVYYKEAVGAFIVFDVTRSGTFDCVSKWKEDLDSKVQLPDGSPIPCILLANKCDQDKQCTLSPEKMDEYCKEYGFSGWFETSAKDNINIEEAATALVNKILLNDKLISASDIVDNDKFALGNENGTSTSQTKKSCSC